MARVLIVDDHPLVADGIKAMLQSYSEITVCGVCKNAAECSEQLAAGVVDVVLLDLNLPDMDGMVLGRELLAKYPHVHIIALTSLGDSSIIAKCLSDGFKGYLLKDMERSELIDAIHRVMDGKLYVSASANERLLNHFSSAREAANQVVVLTRREKEILILLDQGMNGPQISEKLFLSPYTVETHRKNMMRKLEVSNTQLLIHKAQNLRLI